MPVSGTPLVNEVATESISHVITTEVPCLMVRLKLPLLKAATRAKIEVLVKSPQM